MKDLNDPLKMVYRSTWHDTRAGTYRSINEI